ncbi:hypothetical protein GLOIN_2v1765146 [Rhizophagus irregularis DAOM 181602=DAOM 197198]|uniref:Uncharacterized protein n=1 Tax=Rhizophagus irregularis (strain DAOM 181602 / DAOM 197198 / MUCL 43194) TaxID=747089 RepID=A0A2P4QQ72_RHIID|nr:hypothetical protein GLOIN_2v1765146 [Rhizophagus irregularis DAOM 181602=DAOM 197198]POG79813.1 hypothetical protein GLOIN_2v1765146 [Rhizophagus irregularis DAOM 181602=DAOM 197198]|eukprot:XP_025186679.1 hypothetical protein GLOIN_2v1765146 [Rhizophagus irregularis DAOM 181602=DAOM 197198]
MKYWKAKDIEANSEKIEIKKVHISNDNEEKFSKLVLKNDEKEDIKLIRGIISDYWEEQPSNEYTHIIIDSPYLITLRKLKALTTEENIHIIVKAPSTFSKL